MTSFPWVRECLKKQQTFPVYFHDFYIALCTLSSRRIFFRKMWRLSQRQGTLGIKNGFRKSAHLTHVVPWPFISQHLRTESTWVYRKEGGNRRRKRYSGEFPFLCQDQQIKLRFGEGQLQCNTVKLASQKDTNFRKTRFPPGIGTFLIKCVPSASGMHMGGERYT